MKCITHLVTNKNYYSLSSSVVQLIVSFNAEGRDSTPNEGKSFLFNRLKRHLL